MMTLQDILGISITPDEEIEMYQMLAETVPNSIIVQDAEMHVAGMKDNFEPETLRFLNNVKENLIKKIKLAREDD